MEYFISQQLISAGGETGSLSSTFEVKSYRHCGTTPKGTLQNGRPKSSVQRNHASSIPSKFETGIIGDTEKPMKHAFGTRTNRFVEHESSGPGPGHYTHEGGAAPLIKDPATCGSVSRRGYGNLASKAQRFDNRRDKSLDPGPGAYANQGTPSKSSNSGGPTRVFAPTKGIVGPACHNGFHHREDPVLPGFVRPSTTPGPGSYYETESGQRLSPSATAPSHPFKSLRVRFPEKSSKAVVPGPGAYDSAKASQQLDTQGSLASVLSSFASKSQRKGIIGGGTGRMPEETPAPGQYDDLKVLKSLRAHEATDSRKNSAIFSDINQDRFGSPYEHMTERLVIPGPGAYEDGMSVSDDKSVASSFMVSKTERIKPPFNKRPLIIPGPAFYNPTVIEKKSFKSAELPRRWS